MRLDSDRVVWRTSWNRFEVANSSYVGTTKTWGPLAVKTRRRRMEDASRIRSKHMIRMMVIKARLAGETIRCVALVGVR